MFVQPGVGAAASSRPSLLRSLHKAAGIFRFRHARICLNSSAERGPGMTLATTGWASGNCRAAAGSGTSCAAVTRFSPATRSIDVGRRLMVVQRVAAREHAGIERPADDDRGAVLLHRREQSVQRLLFEQRVAPGEQENVPGSMLQGVGDRLRLVDAEADRLDVAAAAQFVECPVAALHRRAKHELLPLHRLVGRDVDIVDIEDVDAIEAEALLAVLVGAHDRVVGVVEDGSNGKGSCQLSRGGIRIAPRLQQATDLGGQYPVVPIAEFVAHHMLGAAEAVVGRRIEVADAAVVGGENDHACVGVGDAIHVAAERGAAKAERRDPEVGPADLSGIQCHGFSSGFMPAPCRESAQGTWAGRRCPPMIFESENVATNI